MSAVIGVATSTGLINSILSSDGKTIIDGSDITILTKLIQKINDTKLTFLKETKMLFFTIDVVLESVLLRKYINKKAHIYTLTSRCELFLLERVAGIEPALSGRKHDILPLNYTRITIYIISQKMNKCKYIKQIKCKYSKTKTL